MTKNLSAMILVFTCVSSSSVFSASFDCVKARSKTEILICNDQTLSKLDEDLAGLYRQAKQIVGDQEQFKADANKEWKWREANCADKQCLVIWYEKRKIQLQGILHPEGDAAGSETKSKPVPFPTAESITGVWKGDLGGDGDMRIENTPLGPKLTLSVTTGQCSGTIDGIGLLSGDTLLLNKMGGDACVLSVKFSGQTAEVDEGTCSNFHGQGCGFTGRLNKVSSNATSEALQNNLPTVAATPNPNEVPVNSSTQVSPKVDGTGLGSFSIWHLKIAIVILGIGVIGISILRKQRQEKSKVSKENPENLLVNKIEQKRIHSDSQVIGKNIEDMKSSTSTDFKTYRVLLNGLQNGTQEMVVKQKLAALFKTTPEQIERLLDHSGYVVKDELNIDLAQKYKKAIEATGAACVIEQNVTSEQTLDVDIPLPRQLEENDSGGQSKETQAVKNKLFNFGSDFSIAVFFQNGLEFGSTVLAVIGVGLAIYASWTAFGAKISFIDNQLEKSLKIGKSNKEDFQKFKDQGGLDNEAQSKWRGYAVEQIQLGYDTNHIVNSLIVVVSKNSFGAKLASVENLRSSLHDECGSDWSFDGEQNHATKNFVECVIWDEGSGNGKVKIVVDARKTKSSSAESNSNDFQKYKQQPIVGKSDPQYSGAETTCRRYADAMKRYIESGVQIQQSDIALENTDYERNERMRDFMKSELLGVTFKPSQASQHVFSGQFYTACVNAYTGH